jgi:hypothetical protein
MDVYQAAIAHLLKDSTQGRRAAAAATTATTTASTVQDNGERGSCHKKRVSKLHQFLIGCARTWESSFWV